MFLEPVKIDVPDIEHASLGNCQLVQKFSNGNAIIKPLSRENLLTSDEFFIIDLRDTNYYSSNQN